MCVCVCVCGRLFGVGEVTWLSRKAHPLLLKLQSDPRSASGLVQLQFTARVHPWTSIFVGTFLPFTTLTKSTTLTLTPKPTQAGGL